VQDSFRLYEGTTLLKFKCNRMEVITDRLHYNAFQSMLGVTTLFRRSPATKRMKRHHKIVNSPERRIVLALSAICSQVTTSPVLLSSDDSFLDEIK
jgi:hypothetical protein